MRWFVAALASWLAAGCIDAGEGTQLMPEWTRHECDPGSASPSGNAPVQPPFDGDLAALIARLEKALGIDVPPEPEHEATGTSVYLLADGGRLTIDHGEGHEPSFTWTHPTSWPGPDNEADKVRQALAALGTSGTTVTGPDAGSTVRTVTIRHASSGGWVGSASWHPEKFSESGWHSWLELRPVHDMSATPAMGHGEARHIAAEVADCLPEAEALPGPLAVRDEPRLTVQHQSLAWSFHADGPPDAGHHCGGITLFIHVDADTGSLHGWDWIPCD